jgi:hypothetical protein
MESMGYSKISTVPEDLEAKRDRWRTRFREIQNEIWNDHPQPDAVPDHLYHYSSLSSIRSILSSRELWLFDVCTMQNDPGDGRHWIEVFYSVLRPKILPDWVTALFQPGSTLGLGSEWHDYVSCFSPEPELQDQWEEFGDHGRGCAIELAFPKFLDASEEGKEYGCVPMFYDAKEQKIRAEKTVDKAIELYCAEVADMTPEEARLHYWGEAVFSFLWCGTRFKDPKFERQRVPSHLILYNPANS